MARGSEHRQVLCLAACAEGSFSLTKRCLTVNTVHASLVSRCSHLEIWTFFHESVVPALSSPVDACGEQVSVSSVRLTWTEDTVIRQRLWNNFTHFPTCWRTASWDCLRSAVYRLLLDANSGSFHSLRNACFDLGCKFVHQSTELLTDFSIFLHVSVMDSGS